MAIFSVVYDYAHDSDTSRDQFRASHREFLNELGAQDKIVVCGPFADDGSPGALLIVRAEDADDAEELLREDPFQREGLVTKVTVRQWNPILGPLSEHLI